MEQILDGDTAPKSYGFLPNFCRPPMIMGTILASQLFGIALTFASQSPSSTLTGQIGVMSFFVLAVALTASLALCTLRPVLLRVEDRIAAVIAWLVVVIIAALVTWGAYSLVPPMHRDQLFAGEGLGVLMVRAMGISAILGAMLLRYLYLHSLWRQQVKAEADARYQTLQASIRPHFLFNSMNTIANLTQTNPRAAEEVVQDLADLFRATLTDANERSTLAQELELAHRYLNIEKQRLGDRLQVLWDVEDIPGDAALPPLILQPLVENAVYHGIAPSRRPGLIQISGRYRRAKVNLSVRNTLPAGNETANRHTRGNHMALDNVRQRMAAMFEGEAHVITARVEGDYQVRLVFPHPWRWQ